MQLFGFEIKRKNEIDDNKNIKTFVEPTNDDGALSVVSSAPGGGGALSTIIDLDGTAKSESELIQKYRMMMQQPEVQQAVDDIVNEAIIIDFDQKPVTCVTDDLELPENIKKKIREEFDNILDLLDFSNQGYDIFSRWYVDGRINYHVLIDDNAPRKGILELRYIDPRKLRKIREYEKVPVGTSTNMTYINKIKNEYYLYTERGFGVQQMAATGFQGDGNLTGLKIAKDSVVNCNSGILNEVNTMVLSHLHKAMKPMNQLRMMEDASVVYRISRAPERRVFYIDVGNLPKAKAEQYLRDMMTRYKNKLVYDANTGDIRDDRRHMSMTDDFWLPRREGGKGTEITTLPGGQNLGEMEDILYFQKKLFKSLNVPISRLESDTGFSLGRASEISRDELKFSKFIRRLRARFSILFDRLLEKQLILKGIIKPEEWKSIQNAIRYDFMEDNHFEELKNGEVLRERLQLLDQLTNYTGTYYSKDWVRKNVLMMTEDEIESMKKEMETEADEEPMDDEEDDGEDNSPVPSKNQETLDSNNPNQ